MRHFIFAIALLLLAGAPAVADRASECRSQCGDDAACYRRCMGNPPSHYGYPAGGAGGPHAYRRAPSFRAPSPATPSEPGGGGGGGPAERPTILGTAYDFLYAPGAETAGYGLYSYVILPRPSERAVAFLREIVGHFPAASNVTEAKQRINILYLPTKASSRGQPAFPADAETAALTSFLDRSYDFGMAQGLLFHLCDRPAPAVAQLCANDLSGGPYILTYATKISDLSPLPPPFLFVDLTNVRPRAFSLFVAAYAAQVKRPDFSDGARLSDFRLQLANIVLTAADWVQPVSAAVADIAHFAEAAKSGGEAPK
ncbi:MAG: hypothetical protein U1E20_05520 [Methylocystis sp.]|uniref:hypothetical protein n=1 Tax=Methylocystis sp. TaxID=1911079 RepID=UPI00393A9C53